MKAEAEYQKTISNWPGLPANLDAVFEWFSNKDLYFFKMLTMGRWVGGCCWMVKEQTDPKISAEIRHKAEIRLRLGQNRTPIYKFRFRLGRNRNLITNFGLNRIFRPKLLKERSRDQTWK